MRMEYTCIFLKVNHQKQGQNSNHNKGQLGSRYLYMHRCGVFSRNESNIKTPCRVHQSQGLIHEYTMYT